MIGIKYKKVGESYTLYTIKKNSITKGTLGNFSFTLML